MMGLICICRNCGKQYDADKSRADYKGYCSQKCLHAMAKRLGYNKKYEKSWLSTEYAVLARNKKLGSVPIKGT